MKTEFWRAVVPKEIRSLILFDRKTFHQHPSDCFDAEYWKSLEAWWLLVDGRKAGCCGFERHETDQGSALYIVTTGIHPDYRRRGLGALMKSWQISYARTHGFKRVVTNSRRSNRTMIELNKKFGFKIVRTIPGYYHEPTEAAVVMELRLS
jgi:ribosomal protein S18 acetylase RimI-like enzyme